MDKLTQKLTALKAKQEAIERKIKEQEAEQHKVVSNVFLQILTESSAAYRSTVNSETVKKLNSKELNLLDAWLSQIPQHQTQTAQKPCPDMDSGSTSDYPSTD